MISDDWELTDCPQAVAASHIDNINKVRTRQRCIVRSPEGRIAVTTLLVLVLLGFRQGT
jgi:hypothetical protein